jgi:hypothetical protein
MEGLIIITEGRERLRDEEEEVRWWSPRSKVECSRPTTSTSSTSTLTALPGTFRQQDNIPTIAVHHHSSLPRRLLPLVLLKLLPSTFWCCRRSAPVLPSAWAAIDRSTPMNSSTPRAMSCPSNSENQPRVPLPERRPLPCAYDTPHGSDKRTVQISLSCVFHKRTAKSGLCRASDQRARQRGPGTCAARDTADGSGGR